MKNKLFIIGIDNYIHHKTLSTCKNDVIDFKNILLEKYDFIDTDVYELINEEATNKKIQDGFSGLARTLTSDDNLIIFFSGHGDYNETEDRGFWIPYDGTKDYTTWIPNETIITLIEKINCKHLFLISDSCFSNSLLNQSISKSNKEYHDRQSRWALTSSFDESYSPKDPQSNSLFAETIIEFLEEEINDFRISKLIEYVKDIFSANVMQTPQGSPLKVNGHKGGEMILKITQLIDNRGLKGYNDFVNVLQLFRRNANFEEVEIFEDKTKKIGFQLYKEVDQVSVRLTFYLYLYKGIIQTQTLKYLKDKYPGIFEKRNFIIFIPKEKDQLKLERRLENIKSKFKPTNIFYIDDFIRDYCTPKFDDDEKSDFLSISNFILPSLYNNFDHNDANEYLEKWLSKDIDPILVIKGTGGIGKTTFAQYAVDKFLKNAPNASVLFIDSVQIKDNLIKKNKYRSEIGIYDFYEALFNQEDSSDRKLTKELFRLNIDAGNLFIVIDGLDEVISKIPNFNVESFLKSISDSSNELGGGKVIITCRTHFWNTTKYCSDQFDVIELKPFNQSQTIEFFNKCFDKEQKRKKALILAEEFKFSDENEESVYHPYVLDIIRSILENEKETIELDLTDFTSNSLSNEIKNDYIIYRVCDRERKRIAQINVDEQVQFFTYLATERRGIIQTRNFKAEIEEALHKNIDQVNIEAFKSHPFLQQIGSSISFRYDFFTDVFKGIYVASIFNKNDLSPNIDNHFLDLISENCWYGSGLNSEIVNRIKQWSDNEILLVASIIGEVAKKESIKLEKKRAIIANIFNISLLINHKVKTNNIFDNTELLVNIFETQKPNINNLCIININTDKALKFDFSNLIINNAFIDNYSSFYDCNYNENTRFIACHLLNIESNTSKASLPKEIFFDCIYDRNIEEAIKDFENKNSIDTDKAKFFLSSFLHLFYSNGRLGRQWEEKVIKPRFTGIDKYNYGYKKTMRVMKRHDLIISSNEKEGIKLAINDKYKEDVIRFVKDGTMASIISQLVIDLK